MGIQPALHVLLHANQARYSAEINPTSQNTPFDKIQSSHKRLLCRDLRRMHFTMSSSEGCDYQAGCMLRHTLPTHTPGLTHRIMEQGQLPSIPATDSQSFESLHLPMEMLWY